MENKQNIKDLVQKFYPYAKETLGFEHPVRVIMRQDAENAQNSLGKTAYYDPEEKLIVLYITDRHPKDVLRSFSHELVHHAQNCRGELDDLITGGHYAEGGKGREIESEAYLQGNLNVRDWEDNIKFKGVNEMKLTKSQLKGIVEAAIKQMSEGFPDLTGDGKVTQADILKGRGVKLKEEDLDEAQDFSALSSVVQELRMLADGQLDDFNNMAPTEYFKVLADKLENAMRDLSGASDMASSPMEEQEVENSLDEQAPPKPELPPNWRSLPANDPARVAYRDWMRKYGQKAKSSLPAMGAEDIGKELDSPALSKVTGGGKDFGAELAARAAGTYKDPKMVAKAKSMAGELGDLYKKTGAMDVDLDKALAKAQGVDVIGDPMKIVAMSDEKKEQMIQAMEDSDDTEVQQAAAVLRMVRKEPTAKQRKIIAQNLDVFNQAVKKVAGDKDFAARLKSATADEPTQIAPSGEEGALPFKESNDTWYQGTLYERLVTKWTK